MRHAPGAREVSAGAAPGYGGQTMPIETDDPRPGPSPDEPNPPSPPHPDPPEPTA
jgi:hypothetical protein